MAHRGVNNQADKSRWSGVHVSRVPTQSTYSSSRKFVDRIIVKQRHASRCNNRFCCGDVICSLRRRSIGVLHGGSGCRCSLLRLSVTAFVLEAKGALIPFMLEKECRQLLQRSCLYILLISRPLPCSSRPVRFRRGLSRLCC